MGLLTTCDFLAGALPSSAADFSLHPVSAPARIVGAVCGWFLVPGKSHVSVSRWIAFVCRLVLSHGRRSSTITARLSSCGLAPACRRLCATAEDSDLALTQFLARVPILPEAPRAVVATGILVLV
jgi:hypothetical protein